MSVNHELRAKTTVIYIVISCLLGVIGVAIAFWADQPVVAALSIPANTAQRSPLLFSVGTSLLAAGLVSLGFAITRIYDDKDSSRIQDGLINYEQSLIEFRGVLDAVETVSRGPAKRCLFETEISAKFRKETEAAYAGQATRVDVVGLKLSRFLSDQLEYLKARAAIKPVMVRMLLQQPDTDEFKLLCELESKNGEAVKKDVVSTMLALHRLDLKAKNLVYQFGGLSIQVRFYRQFQPIAFFRVNETVSVRPRIRSRGAGASFYETYKKLEGEQYYGLFMNHFENCWENSIGVLPKSIKDLMAIDMKSSKA